MTDSLDLSEFLQDSVGHDLELADLQLAIDNLRQFSQFGSQVALPHAHQLEVQDGRVVALGEPSAPSVLGLARCFAGALLSESARRQLERQRESVQSTILEAIQVVKDHYPHIARLKVGGARERRWAEQALQTIEQYNAVVKRELERTSWGSRIVRFLLRCTGLSVEEKLAGRAILLPASAVQHTASPGKEQERLHHVVTRIGERLLAPTHREVDAFRLKAITMIRQYGFPSTSMAEALNGVRLAPLCGRHVGVGDTADATVVTFQQTVEPFPGEVIVLEGSFRRNAQDKVVSVPLPDSFKVHSTSTQTGFPHPLQYNGWALCEQLLPSAPDLVERIPLCRWLHEQKRKMALALLPSGKNLVVAKRLLQLKRAVYASKQVELLYWHRRLAVAMVGHEGVEEAFAYLESLPAGVEKLAALYAVVTEGFQGQMKEVDAPLRVYAKQFCDFLRRAGGELLILQRAHAAKTAPLPLSREAFALQVSVVRQLVTFLSENDADAEPLLNSEEAVYEAIVQSLRKDVACFEQAGYLDCSRSSVCIALELAGVFCCY